MAEDFIFTRRHDRAILALLEEETLSEACRASGTQRSTMSRWLKHPVFKARLERERLELFNAAKTKLLSAASEAVGVLQIVMGDERAPKTARVQAARSVLALSTRIDENDNILARLERLERGVTPDGEVIQ